MSLPPPPNSPEGSLSACSSQDSDPQQEGFAWATGSSNGSLRPRHCPRRQRLSHHLTAAGLSPSTTSSSSSSLVPRSRSPSPTDSLLPTLSPVAQSREATPSVPLRDFYPHQPKSLSGIALRAFALGGLFATSLVAMLTILLLTSSPLWRLPFFFAALAGFHFLEFFTTAAYNTPAAGTDSFLLTANWPHYAIAHTAASLECLVTSLLWPQRVWLFSGVGPFLLVLGLVFVLVGQTVRSAAMIQCGESFNHLVQYYKRQSHTLVTTGIYARLRHPSYFGFFWWAVGTQLVLGNAICLAGYCVVMWKFFSRRVVVEEAYLLRFFGDEYADYRKRVPTLIPFIP